MKSTAALAFALATVATAGVAEAQACCAGAGVFAPARLKLGEDALAGVQLKAQDVLGTVPEDRTYSPAPDGARQLEFEQDLLGTIRVLTDLQVGVVVPFVEGYASVPGLSESGGGLGDLALNARYEVIPPNTSNRPGVAVQLGASLPTGRSPEDAKNPLQTDATGLGSSQVSLGVDVERAIGSWLVDGSVFGAYRFSRQVAEVTEHLGPSAGLFVAGGYAFRHERALALTLASTLEGPPTLNGVVRTGASRWLTTLGISAGVPLDAGWRLQLRASEDLHVLAKNEPIGATATAVVLHAW